MIAFLTLCYLIFSGLAGVFLTYVTWEKGNTYGFITFALCSLCFAMVWPLVLLVSLTDKR